MKIYLKRVRRYGDIKILVVYSHAGVINPKDGVENRVHHLAKALSKRSEIFILESNKNYYFIQEKLSLKMADLIMCISKEDKVRLLKNK